MKDTTQNFIEDLRIKLYNTNLLVAAGVDPLAASEIVFGKKIADDTEKIIMGVKEEYNDGK